MPTIIALNPRKKSRKKSKAKRKAKGQKKPATKKVNVVTTTRVNAKKRGASMAKRKTKKRRIRRRRNPSSSRGKRVYRAARGTIAGIQIGNAAKSSIPLLFGAIAAKFTAKKFAEGGAEADNWTWKNYLLGLLGGLVAAAGTSSILKTRASAQKVMEGAFLLVAYKFFTNELATKNPTLEAWFGEDDEDFDPYAGYGYQEEHEYDGIGDIWRGGEQDFVRGIDGNWRPVDESHRLPQNAGYGDVFVDPDARYGDVFVEPDSRFGFGAPNTSKIFEQDGM